MSKTNKKEITKKEVTENQETKPKISEKNLAIIITAGILALVFIVLAVFGVVTAIQKDLFFDYLTTNLDGYLEFKESYKGFDINVDVAKPHRFDLDITKLNMVYEDREVNEKYGKNPITSGYPISAGDDVAIWYNGYLLDEEGNKVYVDGMCNFTSASPHVLSIGSNGFVPGFELNLIGKNTGDYSKLEKVTEGAITDDLIVYVNYSTPNKTDSTKKDNFTNVKMDLSEDLDAKYGTGFKAALMALTIGGEKAEIKATLADKEIPYTDVTVSFGISRNAKPIVIETYFPYDYQTTNLRNETAYFEVYVDYIIDYICPEFTDEYLTKKIEDKDIYLTLEELNEYEGATLVEKYDRFTEKTLNDIYESAYKALLEQAIWEHYSNIVKMKKYPGKYVDEAYEGYMNDFSNLFINNAGKVYDNMTGQYKTYDTLDAYITAYLGLASGQSYKTYVTKMAQADVQERMTMFYIMRAENLVPDEKKLNETIDKLHEEYLNEYIAQYMEYEDKTREDYTDEEYEQLVADCTEDIHEYYDEEYFITRAYYTIVGEVMIEWPSDVITLDERRAYPFDK